MTTYTSNNNNNNNNNNSNNNNNNNNNNNYNNNNNNKNNNNNNNDDNTYNNTCNKSSFLEKKVNLVQFKRGLLGEGHKREICEPLISFWIITQISWLPYKTCISLV